MNKCMKRKILFILIVVTCLLCGCGGKYECSKCTKQVSEAYYDPFNIYEYLCVDCAKSYFSPFPYTQYKVDNEGNVYDDAADDAYDDGIVEEANTQMDKLINDAEYYVNCGMYDEAVTLLEDSLDTLTGADKVEISSLLQQIDDEYRTKTIEEIKYYIKQKDYETASSIASKALIELWFDDPEIQELQNEASQYLPKYLMYSYRIEEKIEKIDTTPYVDVNGNRYEKAYRFWTTSVYSDETEILYDTYAINGKYEHFSAVVAPDSGMKNEDESKDTIIYIVGDGEVLFSTYINKNTSPVSIELDITGVSELKVGMRGGKRVRILFAEAYLYEKY